MRRRAWIFSNSAVIRAKWLAEQANQWRTRDVSDFPSAISSDLGAHRPLSLCVGIDPVTRLRICRRTDLMRLGNRGGDWNIATNLLGPTSVVYCVGCSEDISFDLALIDRFGCDVHGFDPTPRAIAHVEQVGKGQPR